MTEEEFKLTATTYPQDINIWYTATAPYLIKGITIPTTNANGENILTYLQQATVLTIEAQIGIFVDLQVSGGEILATDIGGSVFEFYYLDVVPSYDITNLVNLPSFRTRLRLSRIVFTSPVNQYVFNASGYNAVLNNVQDPRLSSYQQLQGTNTQAGIQDSLYSSTGWINGRYEGSKTSQTTYLGISPTIAGKSFEGVYFPRTVTDAQIITQVAAGAVTYTSYFYPGEEIIPTYTFIEDVYYIPASRTLNDGDPVGIISISGSEIPLLLAASAPLSTPIPKVGDIIQITSSLELIKIQSIGSYPDNGNFTPPLYKLTVERGYNYTPASAISTSLSPRTEPPVYFSTPILIFKLQGNKVQGVQRGKVQVKTSGEILHIDRFGYVVSGSNQGV